MQQQFQMQQQMFRPQMQQQLFRPQMQMQKQNLQMQLNRSRTPNNTQTALTTSRSGADRPTKQKDTFTPARTSTTTRDTQVTMLH
jgi:hypothetical protein